LKRPLLVSGERKETKRMGHKFSKRHGAPSKREIKLQEQEMLRDHERREQKREKKDPSKANEVRPQGGVK
jgi:hypothetical protein